MQHVSLAAAFARSARQMNTRTGTPHHASVMDAADDASVMMASLNSLETLARRADRLSEVIDGREASLQQRQEEEERRLPQNGIYEVRTQGLPMDTSNANRTYNTTNVSTQHKMREVVVFPNASARTRAGAHP